MIQAKEESLELLERARETVAELSVAEDREKKMQQDEQRLRRTLETETKQMTDTVQATIKKRRQEIVASYDAEMGKVQDQLKKARTKREKARNQGMKERIAEETAELHSYNRELRERMRETFRKDHVPVLCRNRWYYSLYYPRWGREVLRMLLAVLLVFLALPWGIYMMLPEQKTVWLVLIYLADIVVLGGIYVAIGNRTKLKHLEALREGRQILDQIYANDKKIKVITATIRKDKNEAFYDLEKYDDEIARLEQESNEVADRKREALNTFETVTKNILQDEIESGYREKLQAAQAELDELKLQMKETAVELKERRLAIANDYAGHLGREFLEPFKLQELAGILRADRAATITEAMEVYRKDHTQ